MKTFLPLLLPLFLVVLACKKIDEKTQFEMDYEQRVIIPSSTGINLGVDLFTPKTETNAESTFALNDTRKDKIEEIKLLQLDLKIAAPSGADFSFLESIQIYVNAEGLGEQELAWNTEVSNQAGGEINLNVSVADFKEYIKKDEFTLRLRTITDELLTSDYQIDVISKFFVDAKIIGKG